MKRNCSNLRHVTKIEECDNLIKKILLDLPLKFAFQCKCINKKFNDLISNPHFVSEHVTRNNVLVHFPASLTPENFYRLSLSPPYYATNPFGTSLKLSSNTKAIGSSSGLLLIAVRVYTKLCVFNPINRKYQLVPISMYTVESIGIISEQVTVSLHQYKLVSLYKTNTPFPNEDVVYGFKIFSSEENSWRSSNTSISCKQCNIYNAVHFLRECGDIVVFDMKKERARVVNVPHGLKVRYCKMWFGVSKGFITLISSVSSGDLVFWEVHDYENFEWKIGFRINLLAISGLEISSNNFNNPIFFDGERLVLEHYRTNKSKREIYMHDFELGKWVKIGMKAKINDNFQVYYSFLPSSIEVKGVDNALNKTTTPDLPFDLVRTMLGFIKLLST